MKLQNVSLKTLPLLFLFCAVSHSFAAAGNHKARMDALTRELQEAAAANDQPRVRRIAAELKQEADAASREIQGRPEVQSRRADLQATQQRAQGAIDNIKITTDSLDYKIMAAAQKGDLAEVRRLRAQGAPLNALSTFVTPPLHAAARRGDVPMATYLMAEGAQMQVGEGVKVRHALLSAVDATPSSKDNSAMIRFLVSKGADVNYRLTSEFVPTGDPRRDALLRERHDKMQGDTALMIAVRKKNIAHVRTLLSLRANPTLYSVGQTPLQVAQRQNNTEAVRLLTAAGAH